MLNTKIVALVALQLLSPLLTQPASAAPAPARATRTPVVVPTCTKAQYLNTRNNTCVDCSTAFPGSSTCGSTGATACSYGSLRNRQCIPVTCGLTSGTYPSPTNGTKCVPCPTGASSCTAQGVALLCSGSAVNGKCIPYLTATNVTSLSYFTGPNGSTLQPAYQSIPGNSGPWPTLQSCAQTVMSSGNSNRGVFFYNSKLRSKTANCAYISDMKADPTGSWGIYFFTTCADGPNGPDGFSFEYASGKLVNRTVAGGPWTCHDMTL